MFRDRTQAGAALAATLPEYRRKTNVTVIGLARGGVEVAAELARLLDQPLDVLCVRKVAMPGHPDSLPIAALKKARRPAKQKMPPIGWHFIDGIVRMSPFLCITS